MCCSRSLTKHMTAGDNTLNFTSNSLDLKDLMNNACATLDFKLLAIEEKIVPNHESPCLYDSSKIDFSCCSITDVEHAHLYISTNILNQHYIILFANRTLSYKSDISGLVDKICNSIGRLKKQNSVFPHIDQFSQLRFYIYFFGKEPPISINDFTRYCNMFARMLEQRLGYEKYGLDACVWPSMIKCPHRLTISIKDNLLDFAFS